jgi:hypothetical protein
MFCGTPPLLVSLSRSRSVSGFCVCVTSILIFIRAWNFSQEERHNAVTHYASCLFAQCVAPVNHLTQTNASFHSAFDLLLSVLVDLNQLNIHQLIKDGLDGRLIYQS